MRRQKLSQQCQWQPSPPCPAAAAATSSRSTIDGAASMMYLTFHNSTTIDSNNAKHTSTFASHIPLPS
jgi:hypothetical protein